MTQSEALARELARIFLESGSYDERTECEKIAKQKGVKREFSKHVVQYLFTRKLP
jgi:hypothetical protein